MLKVSVIVPVYNVEKYLVRCVDSILTQTYSSLEIILVDDGSSDGSGGICDRYAEADERVTVFHQTNGGPSSARNKGLNVATGSYIVFVDSDDWLESDAIEQEVQFLEMHHLAMVRCGFYREFPEKTKAFCVPEKDTILTAEEAITQLADYSSGKLGIVINSACMCVFKRELFQEIRFPMGRLYEDVSTSADLVYAAGCIGVLSGGPYYHYNQCNDNSIEHIIDCKNLIDYWKALKERYDKYSVLLPNLTEKLALSCMKAIRRTWYYAMFQPSESIQPYMSDLREMSQFVRQNKAVAKIGPMQWRWALWNARYPTVWSLRIVNFVYRIAEKMCIG